MTFGNRENMVSYFLTVFENHRKSIIQHCERSELCLHFEWTKVNQKCQKWSILSKFVVKQCYQTGQIQLDKSWNGMGGYKKRNSRKYEN